jgi:hypothetical protein
VIVAVAAARVVQVAIDQIVRVVAMRNSLVPATGAVLVSRVVSAAAVTGGAVGGVRAADRDGVLVHVVAMGVMEAAVVEIVRVPVVLHGGVTAAVAVLVLVLLVDLVIAHVFLPFGLRLG